MKKTIIISLIIAGALLAMYPAGKPQPLKLEVPEGWPKPFDIFKNNPPTDAGFQLGRKLFYDGRLSRDGKFPCSSCHEQKAAFATFDHDFSHGFNDQFTTRNAPALQNLAWQLSFHWDGKFHDLPTQALSPLTASNEMAADVDSVIRVLKRDKEYTKLFAKAFGSKEITQERMLKALSQFTGMIVSANSKYDRMKKGLEKFNASEEHGYELFQQNCQSCHPPPLFTDNSFRNNGLESDPYLKDYGRMSVSGDRNDSLKFRVPSLRNAGVSQPYMHDGRFYSLQSVVEHYTKGIQESATLDSLLRKPIVFSPKEKYDLVLFLYTLTDSVLLSDRRFSNPSLKIPSKSDHH